MRAIALVAAALMLAACTSGPAPTSSASPTPTSSASPTATSSASPTATSSPTPGPPEGAVVVTGMSGCQTIDPVLIEPIGDTDGYVMSSAFRCDATASDPRVSGVESFTLVATISDPSLGGTCTIEDAVLTTDDGSWTGTGSCVVDVAGILAPARYVEPWYFGEVTYTGAGAYEGLEYRCFLSGMQGELAHAGWIAEAR